MINVTVEIAEQQFLARFDQAISLAIPVQFNGAQPACFGSAPATASPLHAGSFVGDVQRGGSCNVPVLTLNPHCNGTHTETISHVVNESITPAHIAPTLVPCTLLTVKPGVAATTSDQYRPALNPNDAVITADMLNKCLADADANFLSALAIRTLPNTDAKLSMDYHDAPFFTREAMQYLLSKGVEHLLVDFPSIDRMNDDGHLTVHHLFWNLEEDSHRLRDGARTHCSVTELIYVPDSVEDGHYLLSLQVTAFALDVSPSRPLLIPIEQQ